MVNETSEVWQLILNPHAGGGRGTRDRDKMVRMLKKSGIVLQLSVSQYPGHSIKLACDLAIQGATRFIVAGGDGTLNEVVNGIFSCGNELCRKVTIAMLPVGTGNDWIKTFGIPDDYQQAIDIIKRGKCVYQDLGEISYEIDGQLHKRYFANSAGFGFDAVVANQANRMKEKGASGLKVYILSLIRSYLAYRSVPATFTIDGNLVSVMLFSGSVGIGKFSGGGMMQVPDANPLNGKLHVTLIRKIGIWGILTNFRGLYSGKFIRDRRVSTHTGTHIEIEAERLLPGEADGESLGNGRFAIRVIPQQLRVVYGSDDFLK